MEVILKKFINAIRSDVFVTYENSFAEKICHGLSHGYLRKLYEPPMVEIIENVVNCLQNFILRDSKANLELSTKSVFIHGNKSQVEFDYYGQLSQRELGDLIFIISVVLNKKKYFEKITINQYKKDSAGKIRISWDISNKEQLYLLSRFPTFRGIRGSIIPRKNYNLRDYSGCLGSYGLLYKPGDFTFISATDLYLFIGYKNRIGLNELFDLINKFEKYQDLNFPYSYPNVEELLYCFYQIFGLTRPLPYSYFANYHQALNAFEFSHKYLTVGIGEPVFMKTGFFNPQVRSFLKELMSAVRIGAQRAKSLEAQELVDRFFQFGYADDEGGSGFEEDVEFDFDGGGIGIIHTIINLGEE